MTPVRLENWSTCFNTDDPFVAPEARRLCLRGTVTEDGLPVPVVTSPIVEPRGLLIRTESRTYQLGTIDPDYKRWLVDTGQWANFDDRRAETRALVADRDRLAAVAATAELDLETLRRAGEEMRGVLEDSGSSETERMMGALQGWLAAMRATERR